MLKKSSNKQNLKKNIEKGGSPIKNQKIEKTITIFFFKKAKEVFIKKDKFITSL